MTGASSGIGRATAVRYAHNSVRLALTGRDASRLQDTARRCVEAGLKTSDVSIVVVVVDCDSVTRTKSMCVRYDSLGVGYQDINGGAALPNARIRFATDAGHSCSQCCCCCCC